MKNYFKLSISAIFLFLTFIGSAQTKLIKLEDI